jgi:hypothetical protein
LADPAGPRWYTLRDRSRLIASRISNRLGPK